MYILCGNKSELVIVITRIIVMSCHDRKSNPIGQRNPVIFLRVFFEQEEKGPEQYLSFLLISTAVLLLRRHRMHLTCLDSHKEISISLFCLCFELHL